MDLLNVWYFCICFNWVVMGLYAYNKRIILSWFIFYVVFAAIFGPIWTLGIILYKYIDWKTNVSYN